MKTIDIITPEFRILSEQGIYTLDTESQKAYREGWYPVGAVGKRDREWIQVLVREKDESVPHPEE